MRRILLYRLSFVALGLVVGLLVAELMLRISNVWIGRHSDMMFTILEFDEALGWKMRPNVTAEIDLVDVEGLPVRSNGEGFFDAEFPVAREAGTTCRIVFLGDSMTWGYVREEQRFSDLVAASHPGWESLNFGMGGYGTDQALLVWRRLASRHRPDAVVLTLNPNDYNDNMSAVIWGRRKPFFELQDDGQLVLRNVPVDPTVFWDDGIFHQAGAPYAEVMRSYTMKRNRAAHWLAKNSDLARVAYTTLRALRGSEVPAPSATRSPEVVRRDEAQVKLLGALVGELDREVKEAGGRLVVVYSGEPDPRYAMQQAELRAAGIPTLDATASMQGAGDPSRPVRGPDGRLAAGAYYRYNLHWNPAGHEAVAELISSALREQRLCAPRP